MSHSPVAFTEPGGTLPAFLNVHKTDEGRVRILVRSRGANDVGQIELTQDQFAMILEGIRQNVLFTTTPGYTRELEALLSSAHAIAARKGADTAWERFAESCASLGVGAITARTYKVLPSDREAA